MNIKSPKRNANIHPSAEARQITADYRRHNPDGLNDETIKTAHKRYLRDLKVTRILAGDQGYYRVGTP